MRAGSLGIVKLNKALYFHSHPYLTVPPSIKGTPRVRQGSPSCADSLATLRSHQALSSKPPASAYPSMHAMTGLGNAILVGLATKNMVRREACAMSSSLHTPLDQEDPYQSLGHYWTAGSASLTFEGLTCPESLSCFEKLHEGPLRHRNFLGLLSE